MGQKVIPISLRLNKKKNWLSKWVVEKNEYSNLLHLDLEIRKYFEKLFNSKKFKLIKLNIVKISRNINIYIYLYQNKSPKYLQLLYKSIPFNKLMKHFNDYYPNNFIKIFVRRVSFADLKILKRGIGRIIFLVKKKKRIDEETKKLIYIISYALYTKNIEMISNVICGSLERKKAHKKIIQNINNILEVFFRIFSKILGYRLQFKGRLNGSKRKKKMIFQKGKIPLNTLKYDIKYYFHEFKTPSGICSFKLWFFFKI